MNKFLLSLILCLMIGSLHANPWGKDADLAYWQKSQPQQVIESSGLEKLGETLIAFHQDYISHADGPRSHYFPSSSQYTREAIRKHGLLKGISMGCDRLMRENGDPWVYRTYTTPEGDVMKWDPVP